MIKDSGNRTEFKTGAVRDIQDDKGCCDLMPLSVVAELCSEEEQKMDRVMMFLAAYQESKEISCLFEALNAFCEKVFHGDIEEMMIDVSLHYRDGAQKYGENNWQKGLPTWSFLSSAIRHYLKWHRGDEDEPHDRAFVWNIMCLIWTIKVYGDGKDR